MDPSSCSYTDAFKKKNLNRSWSCGLLWDFPNLLVYWWKDTTGFTNKTESFGGNQYKSMHTKDWDTSWLQPSCQWVGDNASKYSQIQKISANGIIEQYVHYKTEGGI